MPDTTRMFVGPMPDLDFPKPTTYRRSRRRWRTWAWSFGTATLVGAYYLIEGWLFDIQGARGTFVPPSRETIAMIVPWWLTWALLAPVAIRFMASHPIDPRARARTVGLYIAAAAGFAFAHGTISVPLWLAAMDLPPARGFGAFSTPLRVMWLTILRSPTAVLQFLTFAAVYHAVAYARALHERELAASQVQAALVRAELDLLKARLEPHFLFNTLNAITSYIRANPTLAERMVARLARLLRGVLELRNEQEIPLSRELQLVDEYLDIQRLRFGDRLDATIEADADATSALVPALLLQPLVENALHHGLERRPGAGRVLVRTRRDGDVLRIRVEERAVNSASLGTLEVTPEESLVVVTNGNGGTGVGLSTTRSRLAQLHGAAQDITLLTGPAGSAVDITLPFRIAPSIASLEATDA